MTWDITCSQWSPRASQHASDLSFSRALASSVFVECLNVSLLFLCLPHRKERWRRERTPSVPSSQQAHRTHLLAGPLRPQSHGWKPGHYDSPGVRSVQIALSLGYIREWSCDNEYCSQMPRNPPWIHQQGVYVSWLLSSDIWVAFCRFRVIWSRGRRWLRLTWPVPIECLGGWFVCFGFCFCHLFGLLWFLFSYFIFGF